MVWHLKAIACSPLGTRTLQQGIYCRHLLRLAARASLIAWTALISLPQPFSLCIAQTTSIADRPVPDPYVLRVDAELVVLSATVLNSHHALVPGLTAQDFSIYEDGTLQHLKNFSHDDLPATVGILVDNSGSMSAKRDDVIAASMTFARSSNPQDEMFVIHFNDDVRFGLSEGLPFTDQSKYLQQALMGIRAIGQTSLYDAIIAGLKHLTLGVRDKKVLILITDGGDTASKATLQQVIAAARQSAAILYVVAIFDDQDGDQNPEVLKQLTKQTGGEAYFPTTSQEIASICEGIAHAIRVQYTLTYSPTAIAHDGRYRSVVVRANAHGQHLTVRTRAGYMVPLEPTASTNKAHQP